MKKLFSLTVVLVFIVACLNIKVSGQDVPASVKSFSGKLIKLASSSEIVSAVHSQNAKNVALDKIKELDKKWQETSGVDDFMKNILANKCSQFLKDTRKSDPAIVEAFAMDNKGANVGMTNKTSDYWQGDEDKFNKSYNGGKGSIHYGKLSFDESSQTYIIQVSVPVKDGAKTVGAVTFGVDPSQLK